MMLLVVPDRRVYSLLFMLFFAAVCWMQQPLPSHSVLFVRSFSLVPQQQQRQQLQQLVTSNTSRATAIMTTTDSSFMTTTAILNRISTSNDSQEQLLLPSSSASASPPPPPTTTTRSVQVIIRQASLPNDLPSIQACRRSAYPPNKDINTLLSASKSFCNADQIQRPGYVCFIATTTTTTTTMNNNNNNNNNNHFFFRNDNNTNMKNENNDGDENSSTTTIISTKEVEEEEEVEVVLGTADYNIQTGVVNNVYVRDYARKNGLAELMMQAVESYHASSAAAAASTSVKRRKNTTSRPLKLTVSSTNIPAVSLYKKLGFQAKGANSILDGLSSAIPALNFLMEMEKEVL